MLRLGLRTAIEAGVDIDVAGEFDFDERVVERVVDLRPDLVLLESGWPTLEGMVACRKILNALSSVRVVMMSATGSEEETVAAMRAGASGCLPGTASGADLVRTVRTAVNGGLHFDPGLSQRIPGRLQAINGAQDASGLDTLSKTEMAILAMVGAGYGNEEIGLALSLATGTVRNNITRIRAKLDLHSRARLVRFAIEQGLSYDPGNPQTNRESPQA